MRIYLVFFYSDSLPILPNLQQRILSGRAINPHGQLVPNNDARYNCLGSLKVRTFNHDRRSVEAHRAHPATDPLPSQGIVQFFQVAKIIQTKVDSDIYNGLARLVRHAMKGQMLRRIRPVIRRNAPHRKAKEE